MPHCCLLTLIFLCLNACNFDQGAVEDWEHSNTGLYAAAISQNGKYSVISSFKEGTSYWDISQQERLYNWSHGNSVESTIAHIAFSPNGSHVITADLRAFVIWDTKTGESQGYWNVDADIMDVAISDDARFVLLGLKDGRAIHINQKNQRRLEVIAHREERVTTVDLSADGMIAVTGGNDRRVVVWNTQTGKEQYTFDYSGRIKLVVFDQKNPQLFISTEEKNAYVYNLKSGKQTVQFKFKPRQGLVSVARFAADGKTLLLGFPARDLSLWSTGDGQSMRSWRAPNRRIGLSPQSATVFAVAFDKTSNNIMAQASNGLGGRWKVN